MGSIIVTRMIVESTTFAYMDEKRNITAQADFISIQKLKIVTGPLERVAKTYRQVSKNTERYNFFVLSMINFRNDVFVFVPRTGRNYSFNDQFF